MTLGPNLDITSWSRERFWKTDEKIHVLAQTHRLIIWVEPTRKLEASSRDLLHFRHDRMLLSPADPLHLHLPDQPLERILVRMLQPRWNGPCRLRRDRCRPRPSLHLEVDQLQQDLSMDSRRYTEKSFRRVY